MCLFSIFIILALITNSTDKFNNTTSKYILINSIFTGNITHTPRFGETMNLNASFSLSRSSIARFRPIMIFAGTDPQLSLMHFGETMNLNYSSAFFMFILLALFAILARLSSSSFSPDRVFRRRRSAIIARPLGRPKSTTRRRISPFLSFFRHFHRCNLTHPPWTQIFSHSFQTFFDTTWPPLDKQMATHDSKRTSILLPPPNSV